MAKNGLNIISLFDFDADADGIHRCLDENLLIFVARNN